nr:cysteine-rich receptor-like protein kinase [Tanacetum cinerariifolium]
MPIQDQSSSAFTTFSNPLFNNDDLDSRDDESLPEEDVPAEEFKIYSNPLFDEDKIKSDKLDSHYFNDRDTFIDSSSKFDFSCELAHVNPEITESNFDFEEEILQDGDSQREEIDIVTKTDDVLPPSVENNNDSSNDPLLEEADLFLASDNSIPPGIENIADDSEGDIHFLEELLINDSILSRDSFDSNFKDNPLIPRPPLEPPDAETDAGEEIPVMMNDKMKMLITLLSYLLCLIRCFLFSPPRVRILSLTLKLLASCLARVIDSVIIPNQSVFIKGRQILDGCLVANEIIRMAKLEDQNLLIFKVDFEKAFDSVNWNFLLDVMRKIGFILKWRKKGVTSSDLGSSRILNI